MRSEGWDVDPRAFDERMLDILAGARQELSAVPDADRVLQMEVTVIGTIAYEVAVSALAGASSASDDATSRP